MTLPWEVEGTVYHGGFRRMSCTFCDCWWAAPGMWCEVSSSHFITAWYALEAGMGSEGQ